MPHTDPKKWKETHRKHHLIRKEWVQSLKEGLACIKCGEKRFPCLDFHHRDPKEKEHQMSRLFKSGSKATILKEMAKCDVLCRNCHALHHWEEHHGGMPESGNGPVC